MSIHCPKCKTGLLYTDSLFYATRFVACKSCGTHHDIGASTESIMRQLTGRDPKAVKARAKNAA